MIRELSHWGRPLLLEPADDNLPDSALLLGLEAAFRPEASAGLGETYEIEVDKLRVTLRVRGGNLKIIPGAADEAASVKIVADRPASSTSRRATRLTG